MILDEHKCIFLHICKNGGSSIERFFDEKERNHQTPLKIIEKYGIEKWNSYFKFTFVRNPWDRILSWYLQNFKDGRFDILGNECDFTEWVITSVDKKIGKRKVFLLPQVTWLTEGIDFIGEFSRLSEDFDIVKSKIGISSPLNLPHVNKTEHLHYSYYYTEETAKIIGDFYAEDIKRFSYKFERTLLL